jgi:transposase
VQSTDPRDLRIAQLEAALAERDVLIAKLLARIEALETQVASLLRNSTNSSKPPSSDPPGVTRPPYKPSGKKRGGQPGHQGHQRKLLPVDQVDAVVAHVPERCCRCGRSDCLVRCATEPVRSQVVDIPPIKPTVTEHQQFAVTCSDCGATTVAALPPEVPRGAFGPRLSAMLAVCTAKYRLSKRAVREMLSDFLGVELALGSVSNVEKQVSAALERPTEEARTHVRGAPVVHADETSWREDKKKAWLWVAAAKLVTVFVIASSRGARIAKDMLGETFGGVLITDRWSAYNWVGAARQICWSHLIRDFQSWVDEGGVGAAMGSSILVEVRRMFRWWHRIRDGTMSRRQFAKKMHPVQVNIVMSLMQAARCRNRRVRGMAKEMLKLEWAFWTFIDTPEVEPTNNFGERQIRHAVLWRKGCFGTDSADGSRFVERMLTTITTLRQQKRNVLEFITAACNAQLTGSAAPSLLPHQDHVMLAAA